MRPSALAGVGVALAALSAVVPSATHAQRVERAAFASIDQTAATGDSAGVAPASRWQRMSTNQRVVRRLEVTGVLAAAGAAAGYSVIWRQRERYYYNTKEQAAGVAVLASLIGATIGASVVGDGTGGCAGGSRALRGFVGTTLGTLGGLSVGGMTRSSHRGQLQAAMLTVVAMQTTIATLVEGRC